MLSKISQHLKAKIQHFPLSDQLIFNHKLIEINKDNFEPIAPLSVNNSQETIAFVDGGQAEILSAGNFCLSFIRIGALVYLDHKLIKDYKHEFFLLTSLKNDFNKLFYESIIFPLAGEKIISEEDLIVSVNEQVLKTGAELGSVSQIANIARRFAELALAAKISADIVVLDGTLEPSYPREEKYLSLLSQNVCALAKSSSLFTASGNSPIVLLNKLSSAHCWSYYLENKNYFVKLHEKAKHIFRFSGNKNFLPDLAKNSTDALFLGYPYGLIAADKSARVSNEEKKSLKMNILLKADNREIVEYLSATNAHDILDNLG